MADRNWQGPRPLAFVDRQGRLYTPIEAIERWGFLLHCEPFPAMPIWDQQQLDRLILADMGADLKLALI